MKKKICRQVIGLVLIGSMAVAVTACHSSARAEVFQEVKKDIRVNEEVLHISENYIEGKAKIPVVSNISNIKIQDKINTILKNDVVSFVEEQKNSSMNYKEDESFTKLSIDADYEVTYKSDNLISILITKKTQDQKDYNFSTKTAYNFDLNTGKKVTLDKVINGEEDYKQVIKKYIQEKYTEKNNIRTSEVNEEQFYLRDKNIVVFLREFAFNEEIKGKDEYEIPFEVFKEGVNTKPVLQPDSVDINTKKIKESNEYFEANIEIPVISGLQDGKIQDIINKRFEKEALEFKDKMSGYAKISNEEAQKIGYNSPKYFANVSFEEKRNQGDILSIYVVYYQYTGGAHGSHDDIAYNIDLKTGELIEFKDIFKKDANYKDVIDAKINEQIEAINKEEKEILVKTGKSEEDFFSRYQGFTGISDEQSFYLTDDKLGIYFGLYEIASYAAGIPTFEIPLSELEDIIAPIK